MSIITLTTDFGSKDHFVGALKGKIISQNPEVQIIDISHDIDMFNITEASYIINAAYSSFPDKTVHIIGVDIERNINTQHIAMQWNNQFFIAADNGILSILSQKIKPQQLVEINIHDKLPKNTTDLDIFIQIANHLCKTNNLESIGNPITQIKELTELQPTVAPNFSFLQGSIIYIDHFGNCVTNITKTAFETIGRNRDFEIKISTVSITKIHRFYSDFTITEDYNLKSYEGQKLALFNESGFLEIAIYKSNPNTLGSAKSLLGIRYRDTITIYFK